MVRKTVWWGPVYPECLSANHHRTGFKGAMEAASRLWLGWGAGKTWCGVCGEQDRGGRKGGREGPTHELAEALTL